MWWWGIKSKCGGGIIRSMCGVGVLGPRIVVGY